MTEREKLQVLLERVKAASGPDREMDAAVWLALEPGVTRKQRSYIHTASGQECLMDETRDATGRLIVVPSFTASIDAALALVERVLPGCRWSISQPADWADDWKPAARKKKPHQAWVTLGTIGRKGFISKDADAATPAIAILAALLAALAASKENADG